jgi:hypothetical protein
MADHGNTAAWFLGRSTGNAVASNICQYTVSSKVTMADWVNSYQMPAGSSDGNELSLHSLKFERESSCPSTVGRSVAGTSCEWLDIFEFQTKMRQATSMSDQKNTEPNFQERLPAPEPFAKVLIRCHDSQIETRLPLRESHPHEVPKRPAVFS